MSYGAHADEEELQGLTHADESADEIPDKIMKGLEGMREPDEREVNYGSDDDFPGPAPSSAASTDVGKAASEVNSDFQSTIGKADEEFDIELQAIKPDPAQAAPKQPRPKKKLWEVWPSRNKFFFKGLLMTGGETEMGITPNCSVPNLCVWTCILAPCSLYFIWVFPHLWSQGCYAMPVATLMVFMITSGSLLATCCTDPGIIPRREVVIATQSAEALEVQLGYDLLCSDSVAVDGSGGGRNLPIELTSRGYRWCRTCRILRPPRASHCPDCDNCVLRYDHHCPFVNNCVGQRNYLFFFGFVTSVLCLAMMVLPMLFWFLNSDNFEESLDSMTGALQPVFIALIAAGVLVLGATAMGFILWIYHAYLIATKKTTKEQRKNITNMAEEPTLCATRGPRLFDPTQEVDPRDLVRADEMPPPAPSNFCSSCCDSDD